MSKSERIQATISFHEKLFFIALAAIFALLAWIVTTYQTASLLVLLLAFLSLFGMLGTALWNYYAIKHYIEELEDA